MGKRQRFVWKVIGFIAFLFFVHAGTNYIELDEKTDLKQNKRHNEKVLKSKRTIKKHRSNTNSNYKTRGSYSGNSEYVWNEKREDYYLVKGESSGYLESNTSGGTNKTGSSIAETKYKYDSQQHSSYDDIDTEVVSMKFTVIIVAFCFMILTIAMVGDKKSHRIRKKR